MCSNQVLGRWRHKRLSHCFSTYLQLHAQTLCLYINPLSVTEFVKQKSFFLGYLFGFFFFPCIISEGEKCQRVCVPGCVWISGWMHVLFIPSFSDWGYCGTQQAWLRWICATVQALWLFFCPIWVMCSLIFRTFKLFADLPASKKQKPKKKTKTTKSPSQPPLWIRKEPRPKEIMLRGDTLLCRGNCTEMEGQNLKRKKKKRWYLPVSSFCQFRNHLCGFSCVTLQSDSSGSERCCCQMSSTPFLFSYVEFKYFES